MLRENPTPSLPGTYLTVKRNHDTKARLLNGLTRTKTDKLVAFVHFKTGAPIRGFPATAEVRAGLSRKFCVDL